MTSCLLLGRVQSQHGVSYIIHSPMVNRPVHLNKQKCLPGQWHIEAINGPSGSGKLVNPRHLGPEANIHWPDENAVGEQVNAEWRMWSWPLSTECGEKVSKD